MDIVMSYQKKDEENPENYLDLRSEDGKKNFTETLGKSNFFMDIIFVNFLNLSYKKTLTHLI